MSPIQSFFEEVKPHFEKEIALAHRLSKAALETAEKVWKFVLRHKKELLLYTAIGAVLLIAGITFPKVLLILLPGLGFMLCFSNGTELGSDMLLKLDKKSHNVWVPKTDADTAGLNDLKERQEIYHTVIDRIESAETPQKGWTYLTGPSGAGKSALMFAIAKELEEKGHPVYVLNTKELKKGSAMNGFHDARFIALATELNARALVSSKPPILLVDELADVVNTTSSGFNLKTEAYFPLNFGIIATLTHQGTSELNGRDEGILGRFSGNEECVPQYDEASLLQFLKQARGTRIHKDIPDSVIVKLVEDLKHIPEKQKLRILFEKILLNKDPVTTDTIEKRINLLGNTAKTAIKRARDEKSAASSPLSSAAS
jgi:hypothetical protein